MNIIVCVKQVPDTNDVKIDPETNTLIRKGVPSIVNPFDKNALEAALQLRQLHGGKVTVLTMGPPQANDALKECVAMGADEAILLSDRAFGGADTLATSYTLAQAVRKIGDFDLILCGKQAIDGDTAQVGPEMAEHLGIPLVTYASKIEKIDDHLIIDREHEDGYEKIQVGFPAVITLIKTLEYEPRMATIKATMKANRMEIPQWGKDNLDVDENRLGLKGSPTKVMKIFSPPKRSDGICIQAETARESVTQLFQKLSDSKII